MARRRNQAAKAANAAKTVKVTKAARAAALLENDDIAANVDIAANDAIAANDIVIDNDTDLITLLLGPDELPIIQVPYGVNLSPMISTINNFTETVNLVTTCIGDVTMSWVTQEIPKLEEASPVVDYKSIYRGYDPNNKIPGIQTRGVPPSFVDRQDIDIPIDIDSSEDWSNPQEAQRMIQARAERQRKIDESRNAEIERKRLEDDHRKYIEEKMSLDPNEFSPEERFWYYITIFDYKNVSTTESQVQRDRWASITDKPEFIKIYKEYHDHLTKKLIEGRVHVGLGMTESRLRKKCSYFIGMTQGSYHNANTDSEYAFTILSDCDDQFHDFLDKLSNGAFH